MMLSTILGLALLQLPLQAGSGRSGQINVRVPRITTAAVIDGQLDEPAWSQATRLTDFSQYQPVDGRPADDPTEVNGYATGYEC